MNAGANMKLWDHRRADRTGLAAEFQGRGDGVDATTAMAMKNFGHCDGLTGAGLVEEFLGGSGDVDAAATKGGEDLWARQRAYRAGLAEEFLGAGGDVDATIAMATGRTSGTAAG